MDCCFSIQVYREDLTEEGAIDVFNYSVIGFNSIHCARSNQSCTLEGPADFVMLFDHQNRKPTFA